MLMCFLVIQNRFPFNHCIESDWPPKSDGTFFARGRWWPFLHGRSLYCKPLGSLKMLDSGEKQGWKSPKVHAGDIASM